MLLFEAKNKILQRCVPSFYEKDGDVIQQADADLLAIKCIDAQIRLAELLNEFWDGLKDNDTFSAQLTYEMLSTIRFDAKFDEEGMYINEDSL